MQRTMRTPGNHDSSERDDLKYINLRTDGIVFDQMRFIHPEDPRKLNLNADQIIRLLDIEVARSIGARYHNSRIPAGMPRMFVPGCRECSSRIVG